MKNILSTCVVLLLLTTCGFAQSGEEYRGLGYAFFAPGVASSGGDGFAHFGGGGEVRIKRVGLGGEIGYATPWRSFADGIGVFSPNMSYNFRSGKVSPFVTGGYTLFFRNGTANGANFGGGINYWFKERTALRFEVRDNFFWETDGAHLVGFRVGLSFR